MSQPGFFTDRLDYRCSKDDDWKAYSLVIRFPLRLCGSSPNIKTRHLWRVEVLAALQILGFLLVFF